MARRTVKTIASDVDLSSVLKLPDELPKPLDSQLLFGRAAPVELEIGSGRGLFISRAALQCPQHNFLGIEIGTKYARLCAARLLQQNVPHTVMICGDAARVLSEIIPEHSLAAVHVYFPDPWWKKRHRKRRILRPEVLTLIENRLASGGSLHFWTDVEEYFLSTLDLLKEHTALRGPIDVREDETDYRTHFERRTRLHGEAVYRTEYRKDG